MKKIFSLLVIALPVVGLAQSAMLDKFRQKVKDRATQHVDEGMDKAIDKTEEEAKKAASAKSDKENSDEQPAATVAQSDTQPSFAS